MRDELDRHPEALPVVAGTLAEAGQAVDVTAARNALQHYRAGLSDQTRRAQDADMRRWPRTWPPSASPALRAPGPRMLHVGLV